jgi:hypothetical protein
MDCCKNRHLINSKCVFCPCPRTGCPTSAPLSIPPVVLHIPFCPFEFPKGNSLPCVLRNPGAKVNTIDPGVFGTMPVKAKWRNTGEEKRINRRFRVSKGQKENFEGAEGEFRRDSSPNKKGKAD